MNAWGAAENKYVNDIRHPPVERVSTTSSSSSVNCRTVIDDVRDGHPQNTKPKNVSILLYLSCLIKWIFSYFVRGDPLGTPA